MGFSDHCRVPLSPGDNNNWMSDDNGVCLVAEKPRRRMANIGILISCLLNVYIVAGLGHEQSRAEQPANNSKREGKVRK